MVRSERADTERPLAKYAQDDILFSSHNRHKTNLSAADVPGHTLCLTGILRRRPARCLAFGQALPEEQHVRIRCHGRSTDSTPGQLIGVAYKG